MSHVDFKCNCAKVKGTIDNIDTKVQQRMVCMCNDCQAWAHYLGRGDVLDANGGTDILPVMPGNFKITQGFENMKCARLTDKGMYRWFADCCKTPIANAMSATWMPFHGVSVKAMELKGRNPDDVIGPVRGRMMGKHGKPPLPADTHKTASLGFIAGVLKFIAVAIATGKGKPSPFFREGEPIKTPHVLTAAERAQYP